MASRLYSIRGVQSGVGGGPHPTRFAGHLPQRGKAFGNRFWEPLIIPTNQYLSFLPITPPVISLARRLSFSQAPLSEPVARRA